VLVDPSERRLYTCAVNAWPEPLYATPERFLGDWLEGEEPTFTLSTSIIYRAAAFREVGFRRELGPFCDNFTTRVIGLTHGVCYIPHEWSLWTVLPDSISHSLLTNPAYFFDLVDRAVATMRSAEF